MFLLLGLLGYRKKTMFLLGLSSAQISEFSFILIKLGIDLKDIEENILSLLSIVGLITIFISTYLFVYADKIYPLVKNFLKIFERKKRQLEEKAKKGYDIYSFWLRSNRFKFFKYFFKKKIYHF
ncbi:MAG: hypothetical protein KatS3mg095_0681 [Candidatus Parcubacteria bacterium]|nr:MAG: hypothetical protein KatS3mg095_0681 [Candidatus Parcubacteria bacterium]